MLCTGSSNPNLSGWLSFQLSTVKAHVTRVLDKLGVQSRTQAALVAVRSGAGGLEV